MTPIANKGARKTCVIAKDRAKTTNYRRREMARRKMSPARANETPDRQRTNGSATANKALTYVSFDRRILLIVLTL